LVSDHTTNYVAHCTKVHNTLEGRLDLAAGVFGCVFR
jgi:hypothetical protein